MNGQIIKPLEMSNDFTHYSEKLATIRIAEHFKTMHSNKFIKTNEQLYFFNGVYWQKDSKTNAKLNLFVGKEYYNSFVSLFPTFKEEINKITDKNAKTKAQNKCQNYNKKCYRMLS